MSALPTAPALRPIDAILELARWAPSGDNTQPWRFEVHGDHHVVVHGFDTRAHCVYDLDGAASQISLGTLIETISLAASLHGMRVQAVRRHGSPDERPVFDLFFAMDATIRADKLVEAIRLRTVQRRRMNTRRLTDAEKNELESSVGLGYTVRWLEGASVKRRVAAVMFRSAKIRLTMPEAYRVHRDVIEWNARFSTDRVPDQALGVDRASLALMKFVMRSWARVHFFNRFLAGTWLPRIQMDVIPAMACGAHFMLTAESSPASVDDNVRAGRATQRFWLAATRLGLMLQPEMTPLIFARYAREGVRFSSTAGMTEGARAVASSFDELVGKHSARHGVFFGRLGAGTAPRARSTRLDLARLMDSAGTAP